MWVVLYDTSRDFALSLTALAGMLFRFIIVIIFVLFDIVFSSMCKLQRVNHYEAHKPSGAISIASFSSSTAWAWPLGGVRTNCTSSVGAICGGKIGSLFYFSRAPVLHRAPRDLKKRSYLCLLFCIFSFFPGEEEGILKKREKIKDQIVIWLFRISTSSPHKEIALVSKLSWKRKAE